MSVAVSTLKAFHNNSKRLDFADSRALKAFHQTSTMLTRLPSSAAVEFAQPWQVFFLLVHG
jgi:hypothetical protein